MSSLVSVALPVPGLGLLTYRVAGDRPALPGTRVIVSLGSRRMTGCVVTQGATAANTATGAAAPVIKDIIEVLDTEPLLPNEVMELACWLGEYYASSPGEAIAAAMPPFALNHRTTFRKVMWVSAVTPSGTDEESELTARQRDALREVRVDAAGCSLADLLASGTSRGVIERLKAAGLVSLHRVAIDRDPFAASDLATPSIQVPANDLALTEEQGKALDALGRLTDAREFKVALLHGVTGSGKTEVYLRLAKHVTSLGRTVLMLVPEIALTPSLAQLCRQTFGDRVAIQHSGLSDGERHDQWHRIRRGEVDVVVGTRSAVFAPLASPGLIIVDEEHDSSYKQEESPRYHGRDVAVMRGKLAGALVVLGSATPSVESYHHAQSGRYELLVLERRVLDRPLASVELVDMREEYAARGPDVILSRPLESTLAACVGRGDQAVILLNRRGYAASIFCRGCGGSIECPNCSVTLTVHRRLGKAMCHYCNHSVAIPKKCTSCGAAYLDYVGVGTERVEAEIRTLLPTARVARADRDTVSRRGAIGRLLHQFRAGDLDVLVGTQMIAKGHDFPRVTLVGVISADVGLGLADFRAAERTFQLLTQVAGRAGRGVQSGQAIIQTLYPGHYAVQHAQQQDFTAFFRQESAFRRAMRYPPWRWLINVVVRGTSPHEAMRDANGLAEDLRRRSGDYEILGPAPAPLQRLRGEFRVQFLMKTSKRQAAHRDLRAALASRPDLKRKVIVDVDPLSVL